MLTLNGVIFNGPVLYGPHISEEITIVIGYFFSSKLIRIFIDVVKLIRIFIAVIKDTKQIYQ